MVYAAETRELAALEYLIHVDVSEVPDDLVLMTVHVPENLRIDCVNPSDLPTGWETTTAYPRCRALGDAWARSRRTPLLRAPAAPIPEESNLSLNPLHPDADSVRVVDARPFFYDPRLIS